MPRDPYPFPRLQNDSDFCGQQGKQVKERGTLNNTGTSQEGSPWDRLNRTATLASSRREIFHHDPQAPNDSLDFVIKSTYDHHKEFLSSKAETLVQHETVGLPHGRILKNRPPPEEPEIDLYKLPLMKSTSVQRQSIHSINGAIESHHSAATNGGYSRKHDGGFYTC
ncbi:protein CFAP276-like [Porites lutea]|uniref:protein CFAP276-like n=1 Tax=Porites lutea TaxID=51062 RepID=UPI003CC652AE